MLRVSDGQYVYSEGGHVSEKKMLGKSALTMME